jgi:serine/threonine protein kinase/Tol biopolymer transport system component
MPLSAGTRLGPYEILAPLGSGGMGEVYRAKDTRLGRDVALKTLPAGLANDAEQRARFEREARAASSLNHPHICAIYDVGSENGVEYLVMELLEGETAAESLARGPMPMGDVMRLGAQVADALDRAHKKGLIHRDLKPANIMLVRSGSKSGPVQAKLLDFGLARPTTARAPDETMSKALTAAGTIVGTFQYMSPEQVEGREIDARSDIWSLGATLYEMATGARAFDGASAASLISAVLRDEPRPMGERAPLTPPAFERLVAQCLAKEPDDRWQSAGDVKRELDWIATGSGTRSVVAPVAAAAPRARSRRSIAGVAVTAALLVGAAGGWWLARRSHVQEPSWTEFTQLTDTSGVETGPSLSPDGGSFAYSSAARGSWDIYVQRVGGRNPVVVAGDPARDEVWPAFSPDGKQIAFSLRNTGGIFVVGSTGESVRRVTDVGSNPAWSPDGRKIAFCSEEVRTAYNTFSESTLWTVNVDGSAPVKLDVGVNAYQPAWSPSGQRIAFWANVNGQRDLGTIAAAGGSLVMVTSDAAVDWAPFWSPDGRFLYFASDRGGSMGIWRIGIDEPSGRATGLPELIAAGVDVAMDLPHLSADGTSLVFRSKIQSVNPAAIDVDPATGRAGAVRLLQRRTAVLFPTDVSPDGRWIALNNMDERQQDIFIMRSDGTELSRLTDDLARDWSPRFTPDGTGLVFFSNKAGTYDGWSIRLDGSNRTRLTAIADGVAAYTMFSPAGDRLFAALIAGDIAIGSGPWPLTRASATTIKPQQVGGGRLLPSAWSRDGRWLTGPIVLPSGVQQGNALYDVKAGTVRQLSHDAGSIDLAWTADHRRVIYFTVKGTLVIQDVASLERHEIAVALPLPPDDLWSIAGSPDGRMLYYGAQQVEANIWKVEQPKAVKR